MIQRIARAYWNELIKAMRLKYTYLGPVLILGVIAALPLAHPIAKNGRSDYDFIAYGTQVALNLPGYFVLIAFSAALVSSEMSGGAIRMILVRPIRRGEFFAAKFLMGVTYALALTTVTAAGVWTAAFLLGDLLGVQFGGQIVYTDSEMRATYAIALLLSLLPQVAAVSFALFVSVCTRSTGAAVGAAVGLMLVVDTVKYPLRAAPYIFSTYLDHGWQVFTDRADALDAVWTPAAQYSAAASMSTTVLFAAGALTVLARRNFST